MAFNLTNGCGLLIELYFVNIEGGLSAALFVIFWMYNPPDSELFRVDELMLFKILLTSLSLSSMLYLFA